MTLNVFQQDSVFFFSFSLSFYQCFSLKTNKGWRNSIRDSNLFFQRTSGSVEPIIQTEAMLYSGSGGDPSVTSTSNVPLVATETRRVSLGADDNSYNLSDGIVSSKTISSKTRTVETVTVSSSLLSYGWKKININFSWSVWPPVFFLYQFLRSANNFLPLENLCKKSWQDKT